MANYRGNEASKRVIDETRRLYANLLSRPLDDKQLAKPGFKFIQEVTKNLITETRTLRNVFNPSDFETENKTWDKRRRCEFVQRLIDFAANHKQPVVGCVADKLVAGLEPNKTNELLQSLAKIAQARLGGQDGNRPRTFIRRSPNSVSPPKQRTEERRDSSGSSSHNTGARAMTSQQSASRKLPQKGPARKAIPPSRDASANGSKIGSSRRDSLQTSNSQEVYPENSNAAAADKKKIGETDAPREISRKTSATEEAPTRQAANKATVSRRGPYQEVIVSESDVNKNIQQLRSNLDQLQSNLQSLSQFNARLKNRLAE